MKEETKLTKSSRTEMMSYRIRILTGTNSKILELTIMINHNLRNKILKIEETLLKRITNHL